jgi:branched-subunit amino acid aminotransferase/4-amino-4-deoxychorismate lyase
LEVAACGTAVVVTPVNKVSYKDRVITIGREGEGGGQDHSSVVGPYVKKLYEQVRKIQNGEIPDKFNWLVEVQTV